jgi:hypothetical protein
VNFCIDVWKLYVEILSQLTLLHNSTAKSISIEAVIYLGKINSLFQAQDENLQSLLSLPSCNATTTGAKSNTSASAATPTPLPSPLTHGRLLRPSVKLTTGRILEPAIITKLFPYEKVNIDDVKYEGQYNRGPVMFMNLIAPNKETGTGSSLVKLLSVRSRY